MRKKLKIKLKSNTLIYYRKLNKSVHISCELLYPSNDSHGIVFYTSELKNWDDDHEITLNEKTMIENDLKKDFLSHDYRVYFD